MGQIIFTGDESACKMAKILFAEIERTAPQANIANIVIDFSVSALANGLCVRRKGEKISVLCSTLAQAGRGLSLAVQNIDDMGYQVQEKPCFERCGVMLDSSRNAVLNTDTVRYILRKMALMGLNTAMLYTEDVYEVENTPYFGYMRGKYSSKELKLLDDYAYDLGIELVPCIQTLGHLDCLLKWPKMKQYSDTPAVLLAEKDETYTLLRKMISSASKPFRTKRIHVGMDEAWGLGTGRYTQFNNAKSGHEIMQCHLKKVKEILDDLGLHAMMWSDMYFRLSSPELEYYNLEYTVPKDVVKEAPKDIALVYWDYYNEDKGFYKEFIKRHLEFSAQTIFAGGMWSWAGPAPHYEKAIATTVPALEECKKAGIKEVFTTAWGDSGAECSVLSILLGLQMYAEYCYSGEWNWGKISSRLKACTGETSEPFLKLSQFHTLPNITSRPNEPANPGRTLLYQDPLLPLMEKDYDGIDAFAHYKQLAEYFAGFQASSKEMKLLFSYYSALANLMQYKCQWHALAPDCVRNKNKSEAEKLCTLAQNIIDAISAFKTIARNLWFWQNKPHGFEILDIRLGGLIARFESANVRMGQFAKGEIETIEELEEEKLPFFKNDDGTISTCYAWSPIVSAGRV